MSKYLILGDLHCRTIWKDIVAKEGVSCDKIIFLGDYLPPRHDVQLVDPTDACGFLYEVLDYKDQNPDKVILLRGNHDMEALGYYWAECYPKVHPKVAQYCQTEDVKNWFLNNTQWIYQIPDTNIVCSHAGIGEEFLYACNDRIFQSRGYTDPNNILRVVNNIEPCELFGFTSNRFSDSSGTSSCQPCTWIRPQTLLNYGVKGIIHVVGHTPVNHIANLKEECLKYESEDPSELDIHEEYCDIWCCDCLENKQYLIIENGKFKPSQI